MILSILALLLPVLVTAQDACAINQTSNYAALNCGQTGTCVGCSALIYRSYPAIPKSNQTYCADMCFRDYFCAEFTYNSSSGICTTFRNTLPTANFQAGDTARSFYQSDCFILTGDCGIANPSFESISPGYPNINTTGSFNGTGNSVHAEPIAQSVQMMPWSYLNGGAQTDPYIKDNATDHGSYVNVVSNSASQYPTPYGNDYLSVYLGRNTGIYMQQYTSILPGRNYTLSYAFSLMELATNNNGTAYYGPLYFVVLGQVGASFHYTTIKQVENTTGSWSVEGSQPIMPQSIGGNGTVLLSVLLYDPCHRKCANRYTIIGIDAFHLTLAG